MGGAPHSPWTSTSQPRARQEMMGAAARQVTCDNLTAGSPEAKLARARQTQQILQPASADFFDDRQQPAHSIEGGVLVPGRRQPIRGRAAGKGRRR